MARFDVEPNDTLQIVATKLQQQLPDLTQFKLSRDPGHKGAENFGVLVFMCDSHILSWLFSLLTTSLVCRLFAASERYSFATELASR